MPQSNPEATKLKQTRGGGIKRRAVVQVSDDSTDNYKQAHIRHMRREMRNAPLDIPDPEPDKWPRTLYIDQRTNLSLHAGLGHGEKSMT